MLRPLLIAFCLRFQLFDPLASVSVVSRLAAPYVNTIYSFNATVVIVFWFSIAWLHVPDMLMCGVLQYDVLLFGVLMFEYLRYDGPRGR